MRLFTYNTYSCIKGRGIEGCARRVDKIIKSFEGKPLFCLKIDIRKFYPSIRHRVLKRLIRRKIKDKDLLWLLDEIIDSASMDDTGRPLTEADKALDGHEDAHGLPIGNYLSQYLANLCLCYFMHWVNERLAELVKAAMGLAEKPRIECTEYADDMTFYAEDKAVLREALGQIRSEIEDGLSLKLKGDYQIFPVAKSRHDRHGRALDYVGYKFFREQKLMRKSIKQNFCREVARLNKREKPLGVKAYKQAICPWLGWAEHSNSRHLLKTIIKKEYYESIL